MIKDWKTIKKGDYLYAKVPDHPNANKHGYVLEHRVVAEIKLGRYLGKDEVVHHRDGDRENNDPDNLEVMSKSDHTRLHVKTGDTYVILKCDRCGENFRRKVGQMHKNNKRYYCSRRCYHG